MGNAGTILIAVLGISYFLYSRQKTKELVEYNRMRSRIEKKIVSNMPLTPAEERWWKENMQ